MRILIVAMAESIHTTRWIAQIADQGWDLHLYPSRDTGLINPALKNITVHHSVFARQPDADPSVTMRGLPVALPVAREQTYEWRRKAATALRLPLAEIRPMYRASMLSRVIKKLQPDIVHSIEFQHGAYLTHSAYKALDQRPTWIVTNWGSDLYLYGRLAYHRPIIERILKMADYYSCECERDVQIAREMGFEGEVLPVFPNTGGFHLDRINKPSQPPSARRQIIIKGYQHFAGRALVALRALALCADALKGYRIVIYSAVADVEIAAELLAETTGLEVECLPKMAHEALLEQYGKSRVYIGLSISDAISTSLLESMVMGAFPIQSGTACADEWITDGESGLIVPPEDPQIIAEAVRRAVSDDALVDAAAEKNAATCAERLNYADIKAKAVAFYTTVYEATRQKARQQHG
jgi:glycosyltransferase involved in cell wall biosynthesis